MIKQYRYAEISIDDIFHRTEEKTDVADAVAEILADVRKNGDEALRRYSERFDGAKLDVLEVTAEERVAAMAAVDPELIAILEEVAANIRAFHEKQKRTDFVITEKDGVVLGQKIIPLDRAGVYVPGGTACYPSTVLMDTIPAKIAGVGEIIMTTPAKGGKINPVILAAAEMGCTISRNTPFSSFRLGIATNSRSSPCTTLMSCTASMLSTVTETTARSRPSVMILLILISVISM